MKRPFRTCVIFMAAMCIGMNSISQNTTPCQVELPDLKGSYTGDCKKGFAHGKGEAKGVHKYVGQFKHGLPDGEGTYYYSDSIYHTGNFQEGIREGKGTAYYKRAGKPDSIVKGYWSADVFRGKSYVTYNVIGMPMFDRVEISPSKESGNKLTIETATTTSAVKGAPTTILGPAPVVITVNDVITLDGAFIRKLDIVNNIKYTATYEISKFPARLQVILSNGQLFNLELYKKADWNVLLFMNK